MHVSLECKVDVLSGNSRLLLLNADQWGCVLNTVVDVMLVPERKRFYSPGLVEHQPHWQLSSVIQAEISAVGWNLLSHLDALLI